MSDPTRLREYACRYGAHTLAYSTLQPYLSYFLIEPHGYIAYDVSRRLGGARLVLGDPVARGDSFGKLLDQLLDESPASRFFQVGEETARLLSARGFFVNEMGVETILDLQPFHPSPYVRRSVRLAEREGAEFREMDDADDYRRQILEVSDHWLRNTIHKREHRFLVRPLVPWDDQQVRRFGAFKGDRLSAFVFFDPMFEQESVTGYYAALLRTREIPPGVLRTFLIARASETFAAEGVRHVSLGLSPFWHMRRRNDSSSGTHYMLAGMRTLGRLNIYGFPGLAEHKKRYLGSEHATFFATPRACDVRGIMAGLRVTGLIP